jgi:hypothetical protein
LPQDIPIEEQSKLFVAKAIAATAAGNANWAFDTILKFVMGQLERVNIATQQSVNNFFVCRNHSDFLSPSFADIIFFRLLA